MKLVANAPAQGQLLMWPNALKAASAVKNSTLAGSEIFANVRSVWPEMACWGRDFFSKGRTAPPARRGAVAFRVSVAVVMWCI